jgi:hypothetical protein
MAQAFLHGQQHRAARLHMHHPGSRQANSGQAGREQVEALGRPQHRAPGARQDARHQQGGRRGVLHIGPSPGDLVQGATRQAATRQPAIQRRNAERNHGTCLVLAVALDAGHLVAQFVQQCGFAQSRHELPLSKRKNIKRTKKF